MPIRILKTIYLPPTEIKPYKNNPKNHTDEQIDKIIRSIELTGFDQPIVVNKDMVIIKGHGRLQASIKMGLKEVPVIVLDVPKDIADKARLIDNKSAEGGYDIEKLLSELQKFGDELIDTGYEKDEFDSLIKELEKQNQIDIDNWTESESPDDFKEYDEDIDIEHTCPKCGYKWSGGK